MNRKVLIVIAAGGSALLLAGAFVFQSLGYLPCKMCLWQRWPHAAAFAIGLVALFVPLPALLWLGALAAAATAGIGFYHSGVEQKWWQGPASCTQAGNGLGGLSGGDLLSMDGPALILCDQISWTFAGLSMPTWNAILSLVLAGVWVAAARART